ncbi:MAG: M23 family metallopeptidase [Anaerolineae bacterium]|nr:M23 family metallopeptidase [Thermoflexales bacterium]MDW8408531.1 M23 family metallopeptidase [Anaerolineae bacterium]
MRNCIVREAHRIVRSAACPLIGAGAAVLILLTQPFIAMAEVSPAPVLFPAAPAAPSALAPGISIRLTPTAPAAGDVMIVRLTTQAGASVSGQFAGRSIHFALDESVEQADGEAHYIGLLGLDGLFPAGVYTLTLQVVGLDGEAAQTLTPVRVRSRRAYLEHVRLSPALAGTLDPLVNQEEALAFAQLYAGFTPQKWWDRPLHWPARGKLVAVYGNRRAYNGVNLGTYHSGIDISAVRGTPVRAAAPGRVVAVREFVIRGLTVVIDHGRGVFTAYCHLSQSDVLEGQVVNAGDVIGQVGSTGRSQGPHVHFELAVGGVPVDPTYWMRVALP